MVSTLFEKYVGGMMPYTYDITPIIINFIGYEIIFTCGVIILFITITVWRDSLYRKHEWNKKRKKK